MYQKNLAKIISFSAICLSIATVLSFVHLFKMPFGGSVTACSMIFVTLVGYWFGVVPGLTAAFCYGLIQLVIDPYVIHPVQFLLDYLLGFGALGISGFFRNWKNGLYIGFIAGCFGRFLCSFLSGFIFFASYAADYNLHPVVYSFAYNILYVGAEVAITMVVISIPIFRQTLDKLKITSLTA